MDRKIHTRLSDPQLERLIKNCSTAVDYSQWPVNAGWGAKSLRLTSAKRTSEAII